MAETPSNSPGLMRSRMKALTLWQPWASLIVNGAKTIETRSWSTKYRGPLAIHAAQRPVREKVVVGDFEAWPADTKDRPHPNHPDGRPPRLYRNDGYWLGAATWTPLPFGQVIAVCTLVDVVPIVAEDECRWDGHGEPCAHAAVDGQVIAHGTMGGHFHTRCTVEQAYGDYTPGRYAWVLDEVERIDPIPARGRQQLFEVDLSSPSSSGDARTVEP